MVLSAANRTLTPAALEAATVAESHSTAGDGAFGFSTDQFPLGFEVDDSQLHAAATLLRVLFVNDLRNLQTQVDRLIVEMQVRVCTRDVEDEYTPLVCTFFRPSCVQKGPD
jgi:hypothetical protein